MITSYKCLLAKNRPLLASVDRCYWLSHIETQIRNKVAFYLSNFTSSSQLDFETKLVHLINLHEWIVFGVLFTEGSG